MTTVIKMAGKHKTTFDSLRTGQAFIYRHCANDPRELWIKTDNSTTNNATRVEDGRVGKFTAVMQYAELTPVDLEIIVKE